MLQIRLRQLLTALAVALAAVAAITLVVRPAGGSSKPTAGALAKAPVIYEGELGVFQARLAGLRLQAPDEFRGLTVVPLRGSSRDRTYLTLDEALADGSLVAEDTGRVEDVKVINKGKRPVLVIDGEEIVGAKQNRIFNSSFLVPAGRTLTAKVSCVEHGRWTGSTMVFKSAGTQLFGRARQMNSIAVGGNMAASRAPMSDQAGIWREVEQKAAEVGAKSDTQAMHFAFSERKGDLDAYVQHFRPLPDQVGAIFAVHGKIVGMDIFDSAASLQRLYPKLIKSYSLDALSPRVMGDESVLPGLHPVRVPASSAQFRSFFEAAKAADGKAYDSLGEGRDLRITGWQLSGAALILGRDVLHAAVFSGAKPDQPDHSGQIAPPGIRYRQLLPGERSTGP